MTGYCSMDAHARWGGFEHLRNYWSQDLGFSSTAVYRVYAKKSEKVWTQTESSWHEATVIQITTLYTLAELKSISSTTHQTTSWLGNNSRRPCQSPVGTGSIIQQLLLCCLLSTFNLQLTSLMSLLIEALIVHLEDLLLLLIAWLKVYRSSY